MWVQNFGQHVKWIFGKAKFREHLSEIWPLWLDSYEVRRDTLNSKTNRSAQVRLIQAIPSPTVIHAWLKKSTMENCTSMFSQKEGQIPAFYLNLYLNTNVNMKVKYSYHDTAKCSNFTPNIYPF